VSTPNSLYIGDCLEVMQDRIAGDSVDLIYLDPPFNSKRLYDAFIGGAQWEAFHDACVWREGIGDFHEVFGRPQFLGITEELRVDVGRKATTALLVLYG
jgi:DNA modification methylase